jgi:competence protein ComEA
MVFFCTLKFSLPLKIALEPQTHSESVQVCSSLGANTFMNPFLKDPVAQPLGKQPAAHWRKPVKRHTVSGLSRHAGLAMMAAGLTVGMPSQALDVNAASVTQLESLRGIGPRTAKMIVHERSRAGAFASMEDLSDRVKGLGERRVRALSQAGLEVKSTSSGVSRTSNQDTLVMDLPAGIRHTKRKSQPAIAKPEIIAPQSF